jgi:ABC-type lipoprotein release transport system permease subunit
MNFSRSLQMILASSKAFIRAPGLSLALLFTIALGVGSNSCFYGFVEGLTHPASPTPHARRIVSIFEQDRFREAGPLSHDEYQLLNKNNDAFEWIDAARITPKDVTIGGRPGIAIVAAVTENLAQALNLHPNGGAVIGYHLWQSEFDGRPDIIGRQIRVDDVDLRISGVAPNRLDGLYSDQRVDLWIPLEDRGIEKSEGDRQDLWVLASLRAGITIDHAQTALRRIFSDSKGVIVVPFTGAAPITAQGLSRIGTFLNFSAGAVFFIACLNVASLLLGRALRRSHETSLRIALGATRATLMWELLSDSIVISVAGGATGLLLAIWTTHLLPALLFEEDAERLVFAPHLVPIVAASMVCIGVTVVCGMMPVFATVTDRPWIVLQRESGSPSKTMERLRTGLVVGQVAACCVLVTCTALLFAGLHSALETSAGHRLGNPILVTVQAQGGPEVDTGYFDKVERNAQSVFGLSPLAWTARLPGTQPTWRAFRIQSRSSGFRDVEMDIAWLTPETLRSLNDQPIAGRMFGGGDEMGRVAVVDEGAAEEIFGRRTVGTVIWDSAGQPIDIIGVVKTVSKGASLLGRRTIYRGYVDSTNEAPPTRHAHFRVPLSLSATDIELNANVVSPGYFSALGLPLITGRAFSERPFSGQGRVGVINQEAADLYFGGKPLGMSVIDERGVRTEIIGVMGAKEFGAFQQRTEPSIYFPMWQGCPPRMTLILGVATWNSRISTALRRRIESVPGNDPVPITIETLDAQLSQSAFAPLRIATLIGGASTSTAMLLSMLALLSAQLDAEHQRRRKVALHIALGAQRWHIVFTVMKDAGWLAVAGTLIGTVVSLATMRFLIGQAAIITSSSYRVWLTAPLLPAIAVMIASVIPACRASFADPLTIMREDK